MDGIMLTNYRVRGIKTLEKWAEMSFYKKTFAREVSSRGYNVKGVYGENGTGKTGLLISAKILKSIITDPGYLNDRLVQRKLSELVNKKLGYIEFDIEFYADLGQREMLYRYHIRLKCNSYGRYFIEKESLLSQKARSHTEKSDYIYEVVNGDIIQISARDESAELIREKAKNLLLETSLSSLYTEKFLYLRKEHDDDNLLIDIVELYLFG